MDGQPKVDDHGSEGKKEVKNSAVRETIKQMFDFVQQWHQTRARAKPETMVNSIARNRAVGVPRDVTIEQLLTDAKFEKCRTIE